MVFIILGALIILILIISLFCYFKVFYAFKRKATSEYDIPPGKEYEEYRELMIEWQKQTAALPNKELSVTSYDGLTLYGKYYECNPGGPIEIMFHGYKGSAQRDLGGGVQRCYALNRNALLVDQRGAGKSQGHTITFGIRESKDCLKWIDLAIKKFGKETKIIITGISMGAATVLMAAQNELPENVVGVLADCGYTSAKEIIKKIIVEMKLPQKLVYPFIKLGARLFGGFDLEADSPSEAVKHCTVPVIFFHGRSDGFVPYTMSVENYNNCSNEKRLVIVDGADHGLSFPKDQERYLKELDDFGKKYWNI